MELNKKNALKLWDERYGKQTQKVTDFSGREMHKGLYGITSSKYGYTIDHKMPISNRGSNKKCNLELVNHLTNQEKGNKITFTANGLQWQVVKVKEDGCYDIAKLTSNTPNRTSDNDDFLKQVFDSTVDNEIDFAGRSIRFSDFGKDTKYGCNIAQFPNAKSRNLNTCFIAHNATLKEYQNKTVFTANNNQFQVKKYEDEYYFLCSTSILNKYDYLNVANFVHNISKRNTTIFRDMIGIRMQTKCETVLDDYILVVQEILAKYEIKSNLSVPNRRENNTYWINIAFTSPKENDVCKVHEIAIYLNSISEYFRNYSDVNGITLFHTAHSKTIEFEYDDYDNPIDYESFFLDLEIEFYNIVENIGFNRKLVVSNIVKNFLLKCGKGYKQETFERIENDFFERNYVYTDLVKKLNTL